MAEAEDGFEALVRARAAFGEFAYAETEVDARAAFDAAHAAGHDGVALEAAKLLALCMNNQQRRHEALAWAERGMALQPPPEARVDRAHLAVLRGDVLASLGRSDEALASLHEGLNGIDDDTPRLMRRDVLTAVGFAYTSLQLLPQALDALRSALAAVRDDDPPHQQVRSLVNLLEAANRLSDERRADDAAGALVLLEGARQELQRLEALALRSDWIHARLAHAFAAAALERRLGQLAMARSRLQGMLDGEQTELLASPFVQLEIATEMVAIAQAEGDVADARRWAERALAAAQSLGNPAAISDMLLLGSRLAEATGDLARALELHKRYHAQVMNRERQQLGERLAQLQSLAGVQALRAERDVLLEGHQSLQRSLAAATDAARTDVLTGLPNRRALQEALAAHGSPPSAALAMIDVDHFKLVNDHHSHLVGDQVLRRLATLMAGQLRGGDVLGRYGGEEFMLLLPATSPVAAGVLAERLRAAVQAHAWAEVSPGLAVTVSIGHAAVLPGDDFETAVARADAALYAAKSAGRNRVEPTPAAREPR